MEYVAESRFACLGAECGCGGTAGPESRRELPVQRVAGRLAVGDPRLSVRPHGAFDRSGGKVSFRRSGPTVYRASGRIGVRGTPTAIVSFR